MNSGYRLSRAVQHTLLRLLRQPTQRKFNIISGQPKQHLLIKLNNYTMFPMFNSKRLLIKAICPHTPATIPSSGSSHRTMMAAAAGVGAEAEAKPLSWDLRYGWDLIKPIHLM